MSVLDPNGNITATVYDDEDRTVATITGYHDPDAGNTLADQHDSIADIDSDLQGGRGH